MACSIQELWRDGRTGATVTASLERVAGERMAANAYARGKFRALPCAGWQGSGAAGRLQPVSLAERHRGQGQEFWLELPPIVLGC